MMLELNSHCFGAATEILARVGVRIVLAVRARVGIRVVVLAVRARVGVRVVCKSGCPCSMRYVVW